MKSKEHVLSRQDITGYAKAFDPERPCYYADGVTATGLGTTAKQILGPELSVEGLACRDGVNTSNAGCFVDVLATQAGWGHTQYPATWFNPLWRADGPPGSRAFRPLALCPELQLPLCCCSSHQHAQAAPCYYLDCSLLQLPSVTTTIVRAVISHQEAHTRRWAALPVVQPRQRLVLTCRPSGAIDCA